MSIMPSTFWLEAVTHSINEGIAVDNKVYDLAVIGAGPAGEVGAIRAAQLGMSVVLIDKSPHLGGTCLNVGCIPTKALISSAHTYRQLKDCHKLGFVCDKVGFSWPKVMARKDQIVEQQRKGLRFLMKKNKITVIKGLASLKDSHCLLVDNDDDHRQSVRFKNLLIASGSEVSEFPPFIANHNNIYTSDSILSIDHVPESLAVIGAGVVGMEFACLFRQFGSEVTVYEIAPTPLVDEDHEVIQAFTRSCQKQGITLFCATQVKQLDDRGDQVVVTTSEEASYSKVLLAVGRRPVTEPLKLATIDVTVDNKGFIPVDTDSYQLKNHRHIYAVGDVIATQALAHTASAEAIRAVEVIAGVKDSIAIDYLASPNAVYTSPEIASLGKTERGLQQEEIEYQKIKFPFSPSAKAKIEGCSEGFIKILFSPQYRELLGVHIINAKATELIAEFVVGKTLETTLDELAHAIHPHPTISESIMEAAHAGVHGAIHL